MRQSWIDWQTPAGRRMDAPMIITDTSMQLASQYEKTTVHTTQERLHVWVDGSAASGGDSAKISPGAQQAKSNADSIASGLERAMSDFKYQIQKMLLERMLGREINLVNPSGMRGEDGEKNEGQAIGKRAAEAVEEGQTERAGWGLEYDYSETYMESESLNVSAQGVVTTADGRQITLDVSLSMSRQYIEQNNLSLRMGDATLVDPLVLNFSGTAAQLSEETFAFDLDADGETEDIHFVEGGSGFIALDLNGNGEIDDGSELFGPSTGNGMAELAQYDEDGNGWIDEADSVFNDLQIWTMNEDGTTTLGSLRDYNAGAIFTSAVDSPFEMKLEDQSTAGQVRSTGVYLSEDGMAGTVQQIDLAV